MIPVWLLKLTLVTALAAHGADLHVSGRDRLSCDPQWTSQCLFDRPATSQSCGDSGLRDVCSPGPICDRQGLSVPVKTPIRASIIRLKSCGSPAAIPLSIWPVVVDTVDRHAHWGSAHVSQKGEEVWLFHSDTTASIISIGRIGEVEATGSYFAPCIQFSTYATATLLSMCNRASRDQLGVQTSATFRGAFQEILKPDNFFATAGASTTKSARFSRSSLGHHGNDRPSTETLSDTSISRNTQNSASMPQNTVSGHLHIWFKVSELTAIMAHAADLSSTEHCLGAGKCHELNPWLARVDSPIGFGAAKMGVAGLGLYGSEKLEANHPKWALVLNLTVTGAYSAIAVHNSRQGH